MFSNSCWKDDDKNQGRTVVISILQMRKKRLERLHSYKVMDVDLKPKILTPEDLLLIYDYIIILHTISMNT